MITGSDGKMSINMEFITWKLASFDTKKLAEDFIAEGTKKAYQPPTELWDQQHFQGFIVYYQDH